jgi:hypothetical protein
MSDIKGITQGLGKVFGKVAQENCITTLHNMCSSLNIIRVTKQMHVGRDM